jgi:curved DNA-binding protein CbpA
MNFFLDLVATGKIRTKEELRSLYRKIIKKYHPDSQPAGGREKALDFDELKRDYLTAADRLAELVASAPGLEPFRYDAETFISELRDLVARGLPVSARALRKNRAYAASIDYVSKGLEHLYGDDYRFAQLDEQLKFLDRRIPRVYYYALQVFWSCFDCASGYAYAETIAVRHLGCVSYILKEMGFESLDKFLRDLIESAGRLAAKAHRDQ